MIDQGQNDYLLQVQKLMSSDVISTYWSHNMDLLVMVTVDNLLQLYRINFKAQKVFQIQQEKPITCVNFSPDCTNFILSYGTVDGQIKVLKTQNGQSLLSVNDPTIHQLTSLSFNEYGNFPPSKIFPFKQSQITQKLILQISPHKNCNKSAIVKINYFNELADNSGEDNKQGKIEQKFTLLLASSQNSTSIHLNGFVTIAEVNYNKIAHKYFSNNQYSVCYSHYNLNTQKVESILVQNSVRGRILHHVEFQSNILETMQSDIIKFHSLLGYVTEVFAFVEKAYPAAEVLLRDILRQYNSKMNLIDDPQAEGANISPCYQLFRYLNCGVTSTALVNFLTKQVYDTKVLQKLDEAVNQMFNGLHDLLLESVQNSLQRAYLVVHQLKNICSLQKQKVFGIKTQDLRKIQQNIEKLYTMGEVLLVESTQAKFDIRNLLVWLNKATIKTAVDPSAEIQNTKSYLSRYTVDFTRLHAFLQTQGSFKLQNLTAFFSKGNENHSMKIPDCQFRLLGRMNSPEPKNHPQYIAKTKQIQKLLQIQDIDIALESNKMDIQFTYKSFRLQLKQLRDQWKSLRVKPIKQISQIIQSSFQLTKIDQVRTSQLYEFEIKPLLKINQQSNLSQLLLYYFTPERIIVRYNTFNHQRKFITLPPTMHPLALATGVDLILLTQTTTPQLEQQKSIVQVINENWEGEQIQTGKRINKLNGDIIINAGLRGLNLMIVNKNKLVVFD